MPEIHSWFCGLLQGVWFTSSALPSATHTAYLLGSGQLQVTAVLFLVVIPWLWHLQNCWGPLLQLGFTFTNGLSWGLLRDSSHATQCQTSTAFHGPFKLLKPVLPQWLLHYQVQGKTLTTSETQILGDDSQETSQKISPQCCFITANLPAPAGQASQKSKRFHFSVSGVLLITTESSVPANQSHIILI